MKCLICVIASQIVEADLKYQLAPPIPILIYHLFRLRGPQVTQDIRSAISQLGQEKLLM